MQLTSTSFEDGARIPARHAAGKPDAASVVTFSDNISPPLKWSGAPAGTQSFVVVCHDPDVPSQGDDVNQADREVPASLPRVNFFHWVMVDLPASVTELSEGEYSQGFTTRGKSGPSTTRGARHGLNDYTGWFAGNADMSGSYFGYDGPFPPFNDSILHHYVFTVYALDVPRLAVDGEFTGPQVLQAIAGHVLGQAALTGIYTLNKRLG
jgi:Raf kinase inhibitor-like YbhB/YbcL family protein